MDFKNFALANYAADMMSTVSKDLLNQIKVLAKQKFLYSVDITDLCSVYNHEFFKELFKNIPVRLRRNGVPVSYMQALPQDLTAYDVVKYGGCRIFVKVITSSTYNNSVTLFVKNTEYSKKALDLFVEHIRQFAKSPYSDDTYAIIDGRCVEYHSGRSQRTFEDVFIDNNVKSDLLNSISSFLKNRQWYQKHRIPYHYGVMLYGPPGTGKSSIISSIAMKYKLIPMYITTSHLSQLFNYQEDLKDTLCLSNSVKLVVVEDVDSCKFMIDNKIRNDEYQKEYEKKFPGKKMEMPYEDELASSLSQFLNIMDGTTSLENVIWIFTTNHIEKLEPSLIRAGRIDKKFFIDYANENTFNQFTKYHFGKEIPLGYNLKENTSFASVQNDVMIGKTFQEVIDKYRK